MSTTTERPAVTVQVTTTKLDATDSRGAQISVSWEGRRKTVGYDFGANEPHVAAIQSIFGANSQVEMLSERVRGARWSVTLEPIPREVFESLQGELPTSRIVTLPSLIAKLDAYAGSIRQSEAAHDAETRGIAYNGERVARRNLLAALTEVLAER